MATKKTTKKAKEQKPKKVQLEFWSYWLSCGFVKCKLGNLCADELDDFRNNADICGFDVEDLGGTLTVDGEDVSVDFSQAAQECEGVATDWNEFLDTRGIYFIDVDKTSQYAEFEIEGDFDPKKLTLFYRTAIYPGHNRLKILTGVSYGGESLEIAEPDEFNGKGCWYWVFDDNKYAKLSSSEDIEGFQPEDCDWKQFPGVTKPEIAKKSDPKFIYEVEEGSAVIKGIRKGFQGPLLIPSKIDDKPVTSIGEKAFSGYSGLTSVTIPDGVTSIGAYAFYDCVRLSEMSMLGFTCEYVKENAYYWRIAVPAKQLVTIHCSDGWVILNDKS